MEEKDKISEFLGEEQKEEPKKEETPKEPKEKEYPVDIDTTALKEEVREEVSKTVTEKLVKALGGTEADADKSPWEKEGRNPLSYDEIADYVSSRVEKRRSEAEAKLAKEKEEQERSAKAASDELTTKQNTVWDWEITNLQNEGKLPKVVNKDDANDPGVKAIRDLFEVATVAAKEGKLPHKSLTAAYYQFYANRNKQPAGAGAPVSGGGKTVTPEGGEYTYEDIHNSDFYGILKE